MKTKSIIVFLLFSLLINAQTKLQNELIEGNRLKLEFKSLLNYNLKKESNKNIFYVPEYENESASGDVRLPSHTIFISLPFIIKPRIKFSVEELKIINAIPKFNRKTEIKNDKLIYSEAKIITNTKKKHFNVKGYLWINNNYCLQLEVTPAIFISDKNQIEFVKQFKVELQFDKNIQQKTSLKTISKGNNIFVNTGFELDNIKEKYQINTNDSWIDYTKTYLKIGTAVDGIYRLLKSDLEKMGINTTTINPKTFKMFLRGKEIPIYVEGETDLIFNQNDFIEFAGIRNMGGRHRELSSYGEPYNEFLGRYTDTTVYWLTWGGQNGKRVIVSSGNEFADADTLDYYAQIDHYEKNNWFDFSSSNQIEREKPFWNENKTWHEGGLRVRVNNKRFSVSNVVQGKTVKLFTKFQDYASDISANAHYVSLGLNDDNYGDSIYFNKYSKIVLQNELSSDLLNDGNNNLSINSMPTDATINLCIFDWYEVEYPRYLIPFENQLKFLFPFLQNSAVKNIKLQNINSVNYSIWKYGENYKKYNSEKVGNLIVFGDTVSQNDQFLFADSSGIKAPKIYYSKQFKNLRSTNNKSDYIAITHKKFITKVYEYLDFISENYEQKTTLVDVDDIYDEFAYGFFNPEAIKDFLKTTHNFWQNPKPKYVVLIGGATYDYYGYKHKNFGIDRVLNFVPSFGAPVSDIWFVTWDTTDAYVPQMNIGRIPVTTNEEFDWYSVKHRNYVTQEYDEWNKRYLFFSGGDENNPGELNSLTQANQFVIDNYVIPKPIGGKAEHFKKTIDPFTNFGNYSKEYIQSAIDKGGVFISYLGHSGTQTWDNSIVSPKQLMNNQNRYPIISDYGCSTGKFAEPDVTSFSQLSILNPDGQAIAYVGNSSLGYLSTALLMPKLFYSYILKDGKVNVSEAHKLAKIDLIKSYGASSVNQLSVLTNLYIGDPIVSLPIPDKPNFVITEGDIETTAELLTDLSDSAQIKINFNNLGSASNDSLNILILHDYNNTIDSISIETKIPLYYDSIFVKINIKGNTGEHKLNVILDNKNLYEEIYEDDNTAEFTFYVFSSSVRPVLGSQILNGIKQNLNFINPSSKPQTESIIFEVAQNNNFLDKSTYEIKFDSLVSNFSVAILEQDKRYWGRTQIKGDNNYSPVFSFITNGEKYYLADSVSFGSNYLENTFYRNGQLKIDTTKIKFEVFSAGFADGNTVLIQKNSKNYIINGTIRGHYVSVFNALSYDFIKSTFFDLLGGGNDVALEYMTFLDTLAEDNLVCFAIKDDGAGNLSTDLRNKIKEFGSSLIDSVQFRSSWAFIGKKGAVPGSMPEKFSHEGEGPVTVDTTISFLSDEGKIITTLIGPAANWNKLIVNQELINDAEISYFPIGISSNGDADTLSQISIQNSEANLNFIDADKYSKLKFLVNFKSSSDKQSPVLNSLGIDYDLIPELGINYQVVSLEKDTLQQGEDVNLSFYVYNVGESTADSFKVLVEVIKPDNSKEKVFEQLVDSLAYEKRKQFNISYNTTNFNGERTFAITIDAEDKILELYEDNNFYNIPFYVLGDTTKPTMTLTIDGNDIFDGEYISSTPEIKVELNDPSLIPITDTSAISIYLNNNYISYFGNEDILQVNFSSTNPKVTVDYLPTLEDGEYTLRVFGKDASGNVSDSSGITKTFNIINEAKLLNVYNYPNPFSRDTYFTFKLTQIPDEIKIRIFTIAGRLIKEIELSSDQLNFDLNKIYWNGKDDDGDFLGNGVYLYKVIMDVGGKKYDVTQKMAIVR